MTCRWTGRSLFGLVLAFLGCHSLPALRAAPPVLEHLNPAGGMPASTNLVTASGTLDPWPPKVWVDGPGVEFLAQTNSGKFNVVVTADAKSGPRLVRFYNAEGASDPRFFVVGSGKEISELEPNDRYQSPQHPGPLPRTINGQLNKNGDVDSFAMDLQSGQWLDARLDAYLLMSKLDAVLRLVDTNGFQLAWNHDFITLDPRLIWQAPTNQRVVLQVFGFAYPAGSDVSLSGGAGGTYRLHLDATATEPAFIPESSNETEPNDTREQARAILPGVPVVGEIGKTGDEDRFKFSVAENEVIEVQIEAGQVGTPLEALLRIEDAKGAELVRAEDAVYPRDPRIEWRAGKQGVVFVVASSLTRRGGPSYRYRLQVRKLQPDFKLTATASSLVLQPGTTNLFKLTSQRLRGLTNHITVEARGIPNGVTVTPLNLGENDKEPALGFVTASNAPAFSGGFQIVAKHGGMEGERTVPFDLVATGENNGVPNGYSRLLVERVDWLWLTVKTNAPSTNAPAK